MPDFAHFSCMDLKAQAPPGETPRAGDAQASVQPPVTRSEAGARCTTSRYRDQQHTFPQRSAFPKHPGRKSARLEMRAFVPLLS